MWRQVAKLSYANYLIHIIVFAAMYDHFIEIPYDEPLTPSRWFSIFVIVNIPVWTCSWLLHKLVEVPAMSLLLPTKEKVQ